MKLFWCQGFFSRNCDFSNKFKNEFEANDEKMCC